MGLKQINLARSHILIRSIFKMLYRRVSHYITRFHTPAQFYHTISHYITRFHTFFTPDFWWLLQLKIDLKHCKSINKRVAEFCLADNLWRNSENFSYPVGCHCVIYKYNKNGAKSQAECEMITLFYMLYLIEPATFA
jgi:hypothetical protein